MNVTRSALVAGFKSRNTEAVAILSNSQVALGGQSEQSQESVNEAFDRIMVFAFPGFGRNKFEV